MEYVNFGSSGVKVSRLALGLGLRGQSDQVAAQRMIERAIDLGINLIDCANIYGPMDDRANIGQSEEILGRVLKYKRDDLVITSKVASRVGAGPNDADISRYHIMREIDRSLSRLQTDHIDVYLLHVSSNSVPLEETMRALDDLVRSGKVRYIGCCNFAAWRICRAMWAADRINGASFIAAQNPYSLLNRYQELTLFPALRELGLGLMAYSPLAVGLLSGAYHPDHAAPQGSLWATTYAKQFDQQMQGVPGRVIRTVMDVAAELGKSPAQIALAWVLAQPEITCAILGGDTIEHLDDNIGAVGWTFDADSKARLDDVSEPMRMQFFEHPMDLG